MKKIFTIAAVALTMLFGYDANAQKDDYVIQYDQLTLDASMRRFKKAKWSNQLEILNYLLRKADEAYYNCKNIDDVYDLREHLILIQKYYDIAKEQKRSNRSIVFESDMRKMDRKISKLEHSIQNKTFIMDNLHQSYSETNDEQ